MNKTETAAILALAAGFDRFIQLDDLNTAAWHLILEPHDFTAVRESIVEFYRAMWDGKTQLTPRVLLDDVKDKIAKDVRTARAAGLISSTWPDTDRVPDDIRLDLETYRAAMKKWNDSGWMSQQPFAEWCRDNGFKFTARTLTA